MSAVLCLSLGLAIGGAAGWFIARSRAAKASADPIPKHPPGVEEKLPYSLRPSLLTNGERAFYDVLCSVLPDDYSVMLKVRLGDVVNVTYGAGNRQTAYGQVCSKSLDFVIANSELTPVVAIELVEGNNDRNTARTREFVGGVLEKVGIPLESIPLRPHYEESELRAHIAKHVKLHSVRVNKDYLALSA